MPAKQENTMPVRGSGPQLSRAISPCPTDPHCYPARVPTRPFSQKTAQARSRSVKPPAARALNRQTCMQGQCKASATFSVRPRAPRSTRSPACAGWRSRECVDSTNLALERHLNARHGPRETSNRAWAGVGAVLVHGLLARPPINSRSFCRSWLRSRPVPAGLCLGAAGQRPRTGRLRRSLFSILEIS